MIAQAISTAPTGQDRSQIAYSQQDALFLSIGHKKVEVSNCCVIGKILQISDRCKKIFAFIGYIFLCLTFFGLILPIVDFTKSKKSIEERKTIQKLATEKAAAEKAAAEKVAAEKAAAEKAAAEKVAAESVSVDRVDSEVTTVESVVVQKKPVPLGEIKIRPLTGGNVVYEGTHTLNVEILPPDLYLSVGVKLKGWAEEAAKVQKLIVGETGEKDPIVDDSKRLCQQIGDHLGPEKKPILEHWNEIYTCKDPKGKVQAVALLESYSNVYPMGVKLAYLVTNPRNIRHSVNAKKKKRVSGAGTALVLHFIRMMEKKARLSPGEHLKDWTVFKLNSVTSAINFYKRYGMDTHGENPYFGTSMDISAKKVRELVSSGGLPKDLLDTA